MLEMKAIAGNDVRIGDKVSTRVGRVIEVERITIYPAVGLPQTPILVCHGPIVEHEPLNERHTALSVGYQSEVSFYGRDWVAVNR